MSTTAVERTRVIVELTEAERKMRATEQALRHDRAAREKLDARLNATMQAIWGVASSPLAEPAQSVAS